MKKLTAILLLLPLILSLRISVFAFEIKNQIIPSPVITEISEDESARGEKYSISFTDSINDAEEIRELVYSVALDKHGSQEKLLSSNEAYLCAETKNYCQISTDKADWYTLGSVENEFSITLYDDILPLLRKNGETISELTSGFSLYIRILTASENFSDENTKAVYVYTASAEKELSCPPFCFIFTDIPEDAVFSEVFDISGFFSEPTKEDIILPSPQRNGYTFDGWSLDGKNRINVIPEGTVGATVYSHWIPKIYEINYFITTYDTDNSFSFGAADNSHNPVEYTVGETEKIYDIKSPIAGFTFDGWYLTKDFSGERITEIKAGETGDRILYAKWLSYEDIEEAKEKERQEFIRNGKFGDVNDDGKISAADARIVLRATVGLEELEAHILERVDYRNTNIISADNARTTLRLSVGLENLYDILLENGLLP